MYSFEKLFPQLLQRERESGNDSDFETRKSFDVDLLMRARTALIHVRLTLR